MIIPSPSGDWPIPAHLTVDASTPAEWTDVQITSPERRYPAKACSFELPTEADSLSILSRGPHSSGTLMLVQSDEEGESIKVDITVSCRDHYILDRYVKVCAFQASENEYGVGIFTKGQTYRSNNEMHLRFDVVVKLPKGGERPLRMKKFETSMPLFCHSVSDLAKTVIFDSITLRTSNTPIMIKSLFAQSLTLETSNSPIEGSLVSSSSLTVLTTNAQIKTNIQMQNDSPNTSELIMTTANGPIDGQITLASSAQSGGKFKITANSALAAVNINVDSAPSDSRIDLAARTAMAPASVRMPATFEGTFLVTTSMAQALVTATAVNDPFDPTRRRSVGFNGRSYNSIHGTVSWSEEGKRRGSVEVSSSMAPSRLTF